MPHYSLSLAIFTFFIFWERKRKKKNVNVIQNTPEVIVLGVNKTVALCCDSNAAGQVDHSRRKSISKQ